MPPPLWFSWTKFLLVILLLWIWGLVAWKNWLEGRSQKLYKWHTSTILSISGGKNVFDKVLNDLGLSFFFSFYLLSLRRLACEWEAATLGSRKLQENIVDSRRVQEKRHQRLVIFCIYFWNIRNAKNTILRRLVIFGISFCNAIQDLSFLSYTFLKCRK